MKFADERAMNGFIGDYGKTEREREKEQFNFFSRATRTRTGDPESPRLVR